MTSQRRRIGWGSAYPRKRRLGLFGGLILLSALAAACTGEDGGGLGSRTALPSRSGGIAIPSPSRSEIALPSPSRSQEVATPTEIPTPSRSAEVEPTSEPSPKPSKTKEPKPTQAPTAEPTQAPTVVVTVSPQVTITQVIVTPSETTTGEEGQSLGWLLLLLLIVVIAVALIALTARRRGSRAGWTASAGTAYRSCSTLRDRLAQELTAPAGTPWTQLLPLVDGASSTLTPLQTAPPDEQAATTATHAVEALSAVRLALAAGAATPTPSQEAKASLLVALGRLDAALEPLRFEASGRSTAGSVGGG